MRVGAAAAGVVRSDHPARSAGLPFVPARLRAVAGRGASGLAVVALRAAAADADGGRRGEHVCTVAMLTGCVQRLAFGRSTMRRSACWPPKAARCWRRARRAVAARLSLHCGRHRAGARARAPQHRGVRARRRRSHRRQRRRLRVGDEGLRRAVRRTTRSGTTARMRSAPRCATCREVLAELGAPRAPRHPIQARVVYHDACHLAHGQGVRSAAAGTAPGDSRRRAVHAGRGRHLLRQRRHLQPGATGACRAARRAQGAAHRLAGPGSHCHGQSWLHAADRRGRPRARARVADPSSHSGGRRLDSRRRSAPRRVARTDFGYNWAVFLIPLHVCGGPSGEGSASGGCCRSHDWRRRHAGDSIVCPRWSRTGSKRSYVAAQL